jgi:hypothetical protein
VCDVGDASYVQELAPPWCRRSPECILLPSHSRSGKMAAKVDELSSMQDCAVSLVVTNRLMMVIGFASRVACLAQACHTNLLFR